MLERPSRVYRVVLPLLVVAFALSSVGKDNTPSDGGTYWIGAGGWFAFGVLLLVTPGFHCGRRRSGCRSAREDIRGPQLREEARDLQRPTKGDGAA